MAQKLKKTEIELDAMIMREIRNRPECRNIQDVLIERVQQVPNWRCAWIMSDNKRRPACAVEIERKLQRQFDLS